MASTTEGWIFEGMMIRAAGLLGLGLPIAWPNVDFTPPADKKYLRVQFVPNTVTRQWIESDGVHQYLGLLQVSVFWPKGHGESSPREMAGRIVEHFPCDLPIVADDIEIRVRERPTAGDMLVEESAVHIPVMVDFEAYA